MKTCAKGDGIILEIARIGNLLRVAALDPETLTEVTFQAPPTADQATLVALARRKLAFVARRMADGHATSRASSR